MKPLPVVLGALIENKNILLIKRNKPPYKGYWCLPGGKIELGEHISVAAIREIKEETGIDCDFLKLNGVYTEVMKENNSVSATFILFMTTLKPHHTNHVESIEGELKWVPLNHLDLMKNQMVINDYMAIKKFIIEEDGFYYETEMEHLADGTHNMTRFEKIN